MTNYIKDIEEIPNLKPPQETFVDDPTSLQDIHLDELTFDLLNGLKTVSNLHIFHVVYIYASFIKFMIKLQQHPHLYDKFRQQQLNQLEEEADSVSAQQKESLNNGRDTINSSSTDSSLSPMSPPISNSSSTSTTNANSLDSSTSTLSTEEPSDKSTTPPVATTTVEIDDGNTIVCDYTNANGISDEILDKYDDDEVLFNSENIDNVNFNYNDNDNQGDTNGGSFSPGKYIPIETLLEQFKLSEHNSSQDDITSSKKSVPVLESNFAKSVVSEIEYAQTINRNSNHSTQLSKVFQLIKTPNLPIDQFLLRIKQYSPSISIPAYLHSIFMLFKLTILLSSIQLTTNNSYRFIVGALRTCTKLLDDVYQKQSNFTHVVGVNLRDLSKIEVNFCYLINFNFNLQCLDQQLARFLKYEFVELCQFIKLELNEFYNEVVDSLAS
ncbi:Cyclin family protein [Candida parapsilosis]|uniref:Cyclin n=2 Tax=Candida parapsilosis TaxID=5480 RepID=G8B6V1_CANPC|nr:uncharacterized protein CPAR2_102210 [Candida parapsilosis]KAF6048162.1 Cyclin family protein [Candida parapsilosis]KAF6049872.1 Cyclin family protein [Candida parapsilosis]KAF6057735.1 Cyclin family protein [Candida parapsilosis]KAF6065558.1 Cyclin family protein [Candida parapsilosis]KAI5904841.1 hypothetical protein K4G60_g3999 [Candida parapsilosis]